MKAKAGTFNDFIRGLDPEDKAIIKHLRELVDKAAPQAEISMKWNRPWWTQNGFLCYIAIAGEHINFGFSRGAELNDTNGLLEGTGKGMRHIKVRSEGEIRDRAFTALIRQEIGRAHV